MKQAGFLLLVILAWSSTEALPWFPWLRPTTSRPPRADPTLKLVHVIHRHGNRNPEPSGVWESNSFKDASYYPEGFGQLTNAGKLTEYNLGKLLRRRYGSFLGDTWDINIQDFRSTDYNRTKMSGLLVMAGLWPPKGSSVWSRELAWQPIPYNYEPLQKDGALMAVTCPAYESLFQQRLTSEEIQSYLSERYGEAMGILSENTGIALDNYISAFMYYDTMKVQTQLGYPLDEWTDSVYPEPLNSLAIDIYYIWTNTTSLRQLAAGTFIKKVLADTQSLINGTLSPPSRKLFAYSAHDYNVGSVILSLDAFKPIETPPYGSAVLFEVHQVKGVWGLKLFYVDYRAGSPHPLTIPGCTHFCPINEFVSLVEEILPTSDLC